MQVEQHVRKLDADWEAHELESKEGKRPACMLVLLIDCLSTVYEVVHYQPYFHAGRLVQSWVGASAKSDISYWLVGVS
jgi:hypothetical protein